MAKEVPSRW